MILMIIVILLNYGMLTSSIPMLNYWEQLDCSDDSCFAEPQFCNTQSSCRSLIKFEHNGNVDLYLRNFTDPFSYAAFAIKQGENETFDFLLCIPHVQQRLRASSQLGKPINIVPRNLTRFVSKIGPNDFVCSFPASEFDESFRRERSFFVTTGKFVDDLVIYDGKQLYSFETSFDDDDSDDDEDYTSNVLTTMPVSGVLSNGDDVQTTFEIFSNEDSKAATDAIQSISKIAENDDLDLIDFAKATSSKPSKRRSIRPANGRKWDEEDEDNNEDVGEGAEDESHRLYSRRSLSHDRRRMDDDDDDDEERNWKRSHKSRRTPKKLIDEDDDDDDFEDEMDFKKRSRFDVRRPSNNDDYNNRRKPHRSENYEISEEDHEDDDYEESMRKRNRRIKKKQNYEIEENEDDDEDDDEEDDEDDDDDAASILNTLLVFIIPFGVLLM